MPVPYPDLPYAKNALEPYISTRTFEFHYGKHHKAYVDNANKMLEGSELAGKDLVTIIQAAAKDPAKKGLFNNTAQAWNHAFFWQCMKKGGGGKPTGRIAERIAADFGSYEKFAEAFKNAGATLFGSGWAWLVEKGGKLEIQQGANAETPIAQGIKPLLVVDVWEHAYYLDYQNARPAYIETWLNNLVNWEFAAENLAKA